MYYVEWFVSMPLRGYTEKPSILFAVELTETLINVMRDVKYHDESVFVKFLDLIQDC